MRHVRKVSAPLLGYVLLACIAAAAQASPPNAPASAPAQQPSVDAATLGRYVGFYRIGDRAIEAVMTVSLSGTQLVTQVTGQQPFNLHAQTPTRFFVKQQNVEATIDFVTHGNGPATAAILHQGGRDTTMPRLDDAIAARFNSELAAHIQSNSPRPGSEAAARDFFAHLVRGQAPDYSKMSPQLAALSRQQESSLIDGVGSLGELQSVTFQGVGPGGADTYLVKFLTGALVVNINLDSNGIINGLALQQAP